MLLWFGISCAGHELALRGEHLGVFVRAQDWGLFFGVSSGWPSSAWMARSHLRAVGEPGRFKGVIIAGFGFGSVDRRWNGNVPIVVTWSGIVVPGWFLVALSFWPSVVGWRRQRRFQGIGTRRAERRAKGARPVCDGCGYDLRASIDRCPECGRRVPGQVLSMRRQIPHLQFK
jgi:hypothetical protein